MSEGFQRQFPITITTHARERWVQRVVDPKHYGHLDVCQQKNCAECDRLRDDTRSVVYQLKSKFNRDILATYREAKEAGRLVRDEDFLRAVRKKFGFVELTDFFLTPNHKAFLVVGNHEDPPVVLTVMSVAMIEGMILRTLNGQELKPVFHRWKFEAKQRGRG